MNEIHPDFLHYLKFKETELVNLFIDLRSFILEIYPDSNEILYNTHALTAVFSISEKLSNAFCMIPIYNEHLNLGFNKGTLLEDKHGLLTGTGKLIRHIPIAKVSDYRNEQVEKLIKSAIKFEKNSIDKAVNVKGKTISKIKNVID